MKVKDLILALQAYDPELDVVMNAGVDDAKGTANDIDVPARSWIFRNANKEWWRGRHNFVTFYSVGLGEEVVAIVPKKTVPVEALPNYKK